MAQSRIKSGYLLVGAVLCLALVSLLVDKSSQRVELDSVNPFGSVEDVSLPSELGQPPTLSHMLHSEYGPGFADNGEPRRQMGSAPGVVVYGRPVSQLQQMRSRARSVARRQKAVGLVGGKAEQKDLDMKARAAYWHALNEFYRGESSATYDQWLQRRARAARNGPQVEQVAQKVALAGEEEKEEGAQSLRTAMLSFQASLPAPSTVDWEKAQNAWDYFYNTNRLLDSQQLALDQQRKQILARFLPADAQGKVKVDRFVPTWRPDANCKFKNKVPLCQALSELAAPRSPVAFAPFSSSSSLRSRSPPSSSSSSSSRLSQLRAQIAAAKERKAEEQEGSMGREVDRAMEGVNAEQARLNRARMLLYLREFGPVQALFQSPNSATQLPWFPGDFELPRVTDCDEPGFCHDWAEGQYIDNHAAATTNWDTIGHPISGYVGWSHLPNEDDIYYTGHVYDNVPFPDPHMNLTAHERGLPGVIDAVAIANEYHNYPYWIDDLTRDDEDLNANREPEPEATKARTEDLAQMIGGGGPGSGGGLEFDWQSFNAQQARLEQRARQAASMLLSPQLQQMSPRRLFTTADPAFNRQMQQGQATVVGGQGTWYETHHPPSPYNPLQRQTESFDIPKGLPFGGDIAQRPIGTAQAKLQKEERRHAKLEGRLQKVEGLMDKEWGGASEQQELQGPSEKRNERRGAVQAAEAADKALKNALGERDRRYGDERQLQAPAQQRQVRSVARAEASKVMAELREGEHSSGDDPSSSRQRAGARGRVLERVKQAARAANTGGAGGAVGGGAEGGREGGGGGGREGAALQALQRKFSEMQKANERLREKLARARADGYGQSMHSKVEAEEQQVASLVAKRLSPSILHSVADKVAQEVETKAASAAPAAVPAPAAVQAKAAVQASTTPVQQQQLQQQQHVAQAAPHVTRKAQTVQMAEAAQAGSEAGSEAGGSEAQEADDEPSQIAGPVSTTMHAGQKQWAPHYFNHKFWNELYHYFKGDETTNYCDQCVGHYMTAMHDIKLSSGTTAHVNPKDIPDMCTGVCQEDQHEETPAYVHQPGAANRVLQKQRLAKIAAGGAGLRGGASQQQLQAADPPPMPDRRWVAKARAQSLKEVPKAIQRQANEQYRRYN